jgi:predicted GNAT family N-acyltransferase
VEQIVLKVVSYQESAEAIHIIRKAVFQTEQQVDPLLDFDGLDCESQQVVAFCNQQPIGTARIRTLDARSAKVERVAVLTDYRGQGVGQQLMQAVLNLLKQQNISICKIHAQRQVVPFYQKLGFRVEGTEFYEAGIPHLVMTKDLIAL